MILSLVEGGLTYASDIQTVRLNLSGIVFLASLVLFFTAGMWAGLAWLVIAFLISPRSANGGGLAGRNDWRRKSRASGFCI